MTLDNRTVKIRKSMATNYGYQTRRWHYQEKTSTRPLRFHEQYGKYCTAEATYCRNIFPLTHKNLVYHKRITFAIHGYCITWYIVTEKRSTMPTKQWHVLDALLGHKSFLDFVNFIWRGGRGLSLLTKTST